MDEPVYEIMERDTRTRLMLDVCQFLRDNPSWDPVGGVAVVPRLQRRYQNTPYHFDHTYMQALVDRNRGGIT